MANSETSFSDRLKRGKTLQGLIANFTPVFTPGDSEINAANFDLYLETIKTANNAVSTAATHLTDVADVRRTMADDIQTIALSVKDHVTSTRTWKRWHTPVSRDADATRGYRLPKKKTPLVEGAAVKKASNGSQSQQGFADIAKLFGKLIESVKKITGYTSVPDSGLSVEELEAQRAAFIEQNDLCTTADSEFGTITSTRLALYDDKETGLSVKMKSIKKAVRSQYKATSANYAQVKAIKV